ncbi:MAG: type IV toxin-antitoxin system AbiEi family antitoxin domain-containing protein [Curtobacterium sp.]
MTGVTARLAEIAEQRWGLFTVEQALNRDVSRQTLSRMTATGRLIRIAQGVYRMAGAPELEHEHIYAAWLGLGGATRPPTAGGAAAVVAAGVTATLLHGFGDFRLDAPEFIVPDRRGTRLPVRLRVQHLDGGEVTFAEAVPTLTVERTIADLVATWTDPSLVADAVADAARQGLITSPWRLSGHLHPLAVTHGYSDGAQFAFDLLITAGHADLAIRSRRNDI